MNVGVGNKLLLIHFDANLITEGLPLNGKGKLHSGIHETPILTWYLQWAHENASRVLVLLPQQLKDWSSRIFPYLADTSALWYEDDGVSSLPINGSRESVYVINGNRLPMVDWHAAQTIIRRRRSDVLLFGRNNAGPIHHYPETVVVDETGQVVRFKRHYNDSPTFTDLSADEASFLVVTAEHGAAVVSHVVTRGWGLDSVGAMTRQFNVQWSREGCVVWEAATTGVDPVEQTTPRAKDDANTSITSAPRAVLLNDDHPDHNPTDRLNHEQEQEPIAVSRSPHPLTDGQSGPDANEYDDGLSVVDWKHHTRENRSYLFWKRVMDVTLSSVSLVALSPLLLLLCLLIKVTSKGPIFFAHKRQGLGGKEFPCLKFRTMTLGADALQEQLRSRNEVDGPQFKIERDPRLTKLGRWLRRSNLDELPQLLNVLVGHMSLVGPRPSPDKENQYCPAWRRARLSVKPGVTGLWQVLRLRDQEQSDFQEWIYYDIEYARYCSLWLDWQIILYTPVSILAPAWVKDFARQLKVRGICQHCTRLMEPMKLAS